MVADLGRVYNELGIDFFEGRVEIAKKAVELVETPQNRENLRKEFRRRFPEEEYGKLCSNLNKLIIGLYDDRDFMREFEKNNSNIKSAFDEGLICDAALSYYLNKNIL